MHMHIHTSKQMHPEMVDITKTIEKKLWRLFTNDAVNPPPLPFYTCHF